MIAAALCATCGKPLAPNPARPEDAFAFQLLPGPVTYCAEHGAKAMLARQDRRQERTS